MIQTKEKIRMASGEYSLAETLKKSPPELVPDPGLMERSNPSSWTNIRE